MEQSKTKQDGVMKIVCLLQYIEDKFYPIASIKRDLDIIRIQLNVQVPMHDTKAYTVSK